MHYQTLLEDIKQQVQPLFGQGQVATYIPELGKVNADQFAMSLAILEKQEQFEVGAAQQAFSIQSISKVFTLMLAVSQLGEDVYQRVGVEPSGDPFNSLVQLEHEQGLPRNPLINAGAIVISDILLSCFDDPMNELLKLVRKLANSESIDFDLSVAKSEKLSGYRNYAMANFLKSFNRIDNSVDDVLDVYFHQCSLAMRILVNVNTDSGDGEHFKIPRIGLLLVLPQVFTISQ